MPETPSLKTFSDALSKAQRVKIEHKMHYQYARTKHLKNFERGNAISGFVAMIFHLLILLAITIATIISFWAAVTF